MNWRQKEWKESALQNLIEFVDQETTLVNDPMFSCDAVKQYLYSKDRVADKKKSSRYKIAATDVNEHCEVNLYNVNINPVILVMEIMT